MIFNDSGDAKSALAGATKYAIGPKMSLGSSGSDFDLILTAVGVPGGA